MNSIQQLAEKVGFHSSYTNSFGERVFATDESRKALLSAMGFDVANESAIEANILRLTNQPWFELMPDTQIIKSEESIYKLAISYSSEFESNKLDWNIAFEEGGELTGKCNLKELTFESEIDISGKKYIRRWLELPKMPEGYHRIKASLLEPNKNIENHKGECFLIVAPKTCYGPKDAADYKMWGLAAQLYSLKSNNSWGLGDFGDLKKLVGDAANKGSSCIGLNPLHPLFPGNPAHRSPYSPTSRNFLNTIYIDVENIPNFEECEQAKQKVKSDEFQQHIQKVNESKLIDYQYSAWLKYQILEILYQHFFERHIEKNTSLAKDYFQFVGNSGNSLKTLATFDALYEHFRQKDPNKFGWVDWPKEYQSPHSNEVIEFQKTHAKRIGYFQFIQWIADRQLTEVEEYAKEQGMPIGLYLDLAVGTDGSGADVWAERDIYVAGGSVGAPPDATNLLGQDWGLTPINPLALKKKGFKPFVKALRGNMKHAGALRIDHVLGYMRQYWVAPGKKANEGIYISFPFEDMLRIIALESRRAKCIVIGEDLGTTPEGFGEIMTAAGLLSYRVLFFERWENGLFKRPENYPEQSMVTVSTHDLPTLAGWWIGNDLVWRDKLDLYPSEEMGQKDRNDRVGDREKLIAALVDMQVIDETKIPQKTPAQMNHELAIAVQEFLAKAASRIQLIPLEDALGIFEQVNIPGTIDEHPNWLQRLPFNTCDMWETNNMKRLIEAILIERNSDSSAKG